MSSNYYYNPNSSHSQSISASPARPSSANMPSTSTRGTLLFAKSKVYIHPTSSAKDNIPGFIDYRESIPEMIRTTAASENCVVLEEMWSDPLSKISTKLVRIVSRKNASCQYVIPIKKRCGFTKGVVQGNR
ncbi:hypothetical protein V1522DRAFT_413963 [Lipomyces starkeyi]